MQVLVVAVAVVRGRKLTYGFGGFSWGGGGGWQVSREYRYSGYIIIGTTGSLGLKYVLEGGIFIIGSEVTGVLYSSKARLEPLFTTLERNIIIYTQKVSMSSI